jgi:hypothetical protein
MTTPSTPRKAGPLLGTGAQTSWPFTFKVFAASDIAVTIADSLGVETALVLGSDYSVTLNSNQETSPGGTVTYPISGSALPIGSRLTIFGNLPYDQPLDLPSGGNFSPLALENQLDRLTMQIQQLREQVGRAIQVSVTTNANVGLPAPSANELIGWDSTGSNLQNFALGELATAVAYATMRYDTFTGDGAETQFTLAADPVTLANLDVAISGVTQVPGSDYSLANGVLVFTSAPPNGAEILARYGEGLVNVGGDSSDIRFLPAGTGAQERTVQDKLRESISVKDFGVVGDGVADDTAAIQAALDYVGSTGGGTVKLPRTSGRYRITSGLKLPSYVTLEGIAADRFPFNSSPAESCLLADFSNVNQWVIEPKTTKNGTAVAYNDIIAITDTFTYTYNCCVKNLHIEAVNTVPFGAVRMHGCPGSMVENVSAVGTGAGLLVNQCYGGSYVMHNLTKYYGTIVWEDVNACRFDVYNAGIEPSALTVPSGYLMPFMSAFNGLLVGTYKLNTNDHYNRTWGMIVGASTSTSANNRIDVVAERYSGGVFQHQAYGTVFNAFYVESKVDVMSYGCVATVSRFVINSLHAYMSGTGKVFDLGLTVYARITAIGFVDYPHFGYGPFNDASSLVTIDGMSAKDFGPATPQPNLVYTSGSKDWVAPTLTNGWSNSGGTNQTAAYRLNSRTGNVELAGLITGGTSGATAFTLPLGFRPAAGNAFGTQGGGTVVVTAAGLVIVTPGSGASIWLNGVSFYAEQ